MVEIKRVLIANRGDCARRIAGTVVRLGKTPIAVYEAPDKNSLHVKEAVEAHEISSYTDIGSFIDVARESGADAIHPGWGFQSENPKFRKECDKAGIIFIGPTEEAMRKAGNKETAKKIARKLGIPAIRSSSRVKRSDIAGWASRHGLTNGDDSVAMMIKAAKGGGGSGNTVVFRLRDLEEAAERLTNHSRKLWGKSRVFVERLVTDAHHVEGQIVGDEHGHLIYAGSRDCTVQYGNQKVIEEAPAPFLSSEQERLVQEYSLAFGNEIGYSSAGTVEFLLSSKEGLLFMEFNTRVQVEHGVTELVTGLDLVEQQILIAEGKSLPAQEEIKFSGAAIEARVNAQTIYEADPRTLIPAGGVVENVIFPEGKNIRVDHALYDGYEINMNYNPTQAKVIAWSSDRDGAIEGLKSALGRFSITGVETNIPLILEVLSHPDFLGGQHKTTFFGQMLRELAEKEDGNREMAAAIGVAVASALQERQKEKGTLPANGRLWRQAGRTDQMNARGNFGGRR
ncbi:MAG: biotin carboxylase N-terminal domain-containing protein [Patescibacteria group bacterium]